MKFLHRSATRSMTGNQFISVTRSTKCHKWLRVCMQTLGLRREDPWNNSLHSAANNWLILCKAKKPALLLDPKHHYILVTLGINLLNKPCTYCLSLKVITKGSYLWFMEDGRHLIFHVKVLLSRLIFCMLVMHDNTIWLKPITSVVSDKSSLWMEYGCLTVFILSEEPLRICCVASFLFFWEVGERGGGCLNLKTKYLVFALPI